MDDRQQLVSTREHGSRRRSGNRTLAIGAALIIGTSTLLGGCSALGSIDPSAAPPTINVPSITINVQQPEKTKTEEAPAENKPTTSTTTPSSSSQQGLPAWVWILIAVVAIGAVISWIVSSGQRRREVSQYTADVQTRGQWVVDHGVGALLSATDAPSANQAWSSLDSALVQINGDVVKLQNRGVRGEVGMQFQEVRDSVSALRLAAETEAKAVMSGQNAGQAPSSESVMTARRRLAEALAALDPEQSSSTASPPPA